MRSFCLPYHRLSCHFLLTPASSTFLFRCLLFPSIPIIIQIWLPLHTSTKLSNAYENRQVKSVQSSLIALQKQPNSHCLFLPHISRKIPPTQLFSSFLCLSKQCCSPQGISSHSLPRWRFLNSYLCILRTTDLSISLVFEFFHSTYPICAANGWLKLCSSLAWLWKVCGSSPHSWGISQKLTNIWESMRSPSSILQNHSFHVTEKTTQNWPCGFIYPSHFCLSP